MKKILIIQTASIGDVILATALVEKLHAFDPVVAIDLLVKKGMEGLFKGHPYLNNVLIWDKSRHKYRHLWQLLLKIRKNRYDAVVNVQRFASSGLLAGCSGAPVRSGFDKNPLSFLFTHRVKHLIGKQASGMHETVRNQQLISSFTGEKAARPALYPEVADFEAIAPYQSTPYVCIAPASLWNTKQYPVARWIELVDQLPEHLSVWLLGAPNDGPLCQSILQSAKRRNVQDLSGKLTLLQSAALIKGAAMNYVNDSAPMHLASAVNAPVTAIFCSTVPEFGFGPLSDRSTVVQTELDLACRPCGLHGWAECPEKHFNCAQTIHLKSLLNTLNETK